MFRLTVLHFMQGIPFNKIVELRKIDTELRCPDY